RDQACGGGRAGKVSAAGCSDAATRATEDAGSEDAQHDGERDRYGCDEERGACPGEDGPGKVGSDACDEGETVSTSLSLGFSSTAYLLALPMLLLSLFALGILLIDLMLPKQWKPVNAFIALAGVAFSAAAVGKLHLAYRVAESRGSLVGDFTGFMGTLV